MSRYLYLAIGVLLGAELGILAAVLAMWLVLLHPEWLW